MRDACQTRTLWLPEADMLEEAGATRAVERTSENSIELRISEMFAISANSVCLSEIADIRGPRRLGSATARSAPSRHAGGADVEIAKFAQIRRKVDRSWLNLARNRSPNLSRIVRSRPTLALSRPNLAWDRPKLSRSLLHLPRDRPISADLEPASCAKFGRCCTDLRLFRTHQANFGQVWPGIDHIWPGLNLGRIHPANSPKLARHQANLGRVNQFLSEVDRISTPR